MHLIQEHFTYIKMVMFVMMEETKVPEDKHLLSARKNDKVSQYKFKMLEVDGFHKVLKFSPLF